MSTLNLPYRRFVRQVSNGYARTKYSYLAMQSDLLAALKIAQWREARCAVNEVTTVPNKVTATDAETDEEGNIVSPSTFSAFIDDRYDAFKQGGDAVPSEATMCGYAGMVAYRYELPSGYTSDISRVSLRFAAARYLRSGLRVAVVLSNVSTPSDDWTTIRGDGAGAIVTPHSAANVIGVSSWGFLGQPDAETLLESRARDAELVFDASDYAALGTSTRYSYMWVYVSLEDYEDYWELYDGKTPRYYSIEGSAALTGAVCAVTFDGSVSAATTTWRHALYAAGSGLLDLTTLTSAESYTEGVSWEQKEQAQREAFGNLLGLTSWESYLITDTTPASDAPAVSGMTVATNDSGHAHVPRLMRFEEFPRKDLLGELPDSPGSYVELADMGVFAVAPAVYELSVESGSGRKWANAGCGRPNGIGYAIETVAGGGMTESCHMLYRSDEGAFALQPPHKVAMLHFKSTARVVPGGRSAYTRLSIGGSVSGTAGVEARINIWRSTSADMLGQWHNQAVAALLSHQQMFTGSSRTVNATVNGTGTRVTDVKIKVAAELLCAIPVPVSGTEVSVDLSASELHPGDVLIFCPRVDLIPEGIWNFSDEVTFDHILLA